MSRNSFTRTSLILTAGLVLGLSYAPRSLLAAGAVECRLYDVNYARVVLASANANSTVDTVVSIKNPNPAGGASMTVEVKWIDTSGTLIGISGPVAIPPQNTFEYATGSGPIIPFVIDVPPAATLPVFEGSARVIQTDPGCVKSNRLSVNAQVVRSLPSASGLPEYFHVDTERPTGSIGD